MASSNPFVSDKEPLLRKQEGQCVFPICLQKRYIYPFFKKLVTCKDFCSLKDAAIGCAGHRDFVGHIFFRRSNIVANNDLIVYHRCFTCILFSFVITRDKVIQGDLKKNYKSHLLIHMKACFKARRNKVALNLASISAVEQ